MAPSGGGRQEISERLLHHYACFSVTEGDSTTLHRIYGSILSWFLREASPDVQASCQRVVATVIDVFEAVKTRLRPTPSRTHYVFSPRDLSRVIHGICLSDPSGLSDPLHLVRLVGHECERVFADRIVDAADLQWYNSLWRQACNRHNSVPWLHARQVYYDHLLTKRREAIEAAERE